MVDGESTWRRREECKKRHQTKQASMAPVGGVQDEKKSEAGCWRMWWEGGGVWEESTLARSAPADLLHDRTQAWQQDSLHSRVFQKCVSSKRCESECGTTSSISQKFEFAI